MLHRLLFDTTAPDESANVGAYLRASDGTLLTHTTVGGIQSLDVTFTNTTIAVTDGGGSLTVDATDLDIRNLVFATDKVDVSGSAVSITGNVNVTQGTSPWVVSANNLDIRDLTHVSDSVKIGDGTDFLAIDASGNIGITDAGGSLTVDANNLDIRDLVAATDTVSAWTKDGAGTSITSTLVSGKQGLDVNVVNSIDVDDGLANTAIATEAKTVSTTGTLVTAVLTNRKYLSMYNNGSKEIYIGPSGVTSTTGFPIYPGGILETRIGAAVAIHAVAASGPQNVRILQAS